MKYYKLFVAACFLLLSGCQQTQTLSDAERIQIETEISERVHEYGEAVRRKDTEWFQNFWANNKDFAMAGDGRIETNYDSLLTNAYQGVFTNLKEVTHFNWSNGRTHVLSRDAASYTTNFDWGMITNAGDTIKARGSWLYVLEKSDGNWKSTQSAGTHVMYK